MSKQHEAQQAFDELLQQATSQGYITHDQILAFCPRPEQDTEELEQFFAQLQVLRIPVYDGEDTGNNGSSSSKERENESDESWEIISIQAESAEEEIAGANVPDTITLYFREMSQYPLLNQDEERSLARSIFDARAAAQRLAKDNGATTPVDRERLRASVAKGNLARDQLIRANTRLVVSVAKRYGRQGCTLSRSHPRRQPGAHAGSR